MCSVGCTHSLLPIHGPWCPIPSLAPCWAVATGWEHPERKAMPGTAHGRHSFSKCPWGMFSCCWSSIGQPAPPGQQSLAHVRTASFRGLSGADCHKLVVAVNPRRLPGLRVIHHKSIRSPYTFAGLFSPGKIIL